MIRSVFAIYIGLMLWLNACNESVSPDNSTLPTPTHGAVKVDDNFKIVYIDSSIIAQQKYRLAVFKNSTAEYLQILRENNGSFKPILTDSDYTTNNTDVFFKDQNNDGYADIVTSLKWQEHCYLFNPRERNFYEVGELHDIDTLKINGILVLYQQKYPLLYLQSTTKEMEWMTQLHAELFTIDSSFQKISFATLDNFASLDDWNFSRCQDARSVIVNCYIPPYVGKHGNLSIWNSGKSVDSMIMSASLFDSTFIAKYWKLNYQQLLPYGTIFKVRRETALRYH